MSQRSEMAIFDASVSSHDEDSYSTQGTPRSSLRNKTNRRSSPLRRNSRAVDLSPIAGPSRRPDLSRRPPTPATTTATTRNNPTASRRKQKKPKSRVLSEIRFLQNTTSLLIPKLPFCRLLKEQLGTFGVFRMTPEAVDALREAVEMYLVQFFEDAYRCTLHAKRVTLQAIDIHLIRIMRGDI